MKATRWSGVLAIGLGCLWSPMAQGQQWITNIGGNNWLAPNAGFPLVTNATVGTSASGNATLRVRGDQLPVTDAFSGANCTFRTDVGPAISQNWSMVRGNIEIGRLWHPTFADAFNVQAMQGPLRLRNGAGDGIRINGTNTTTVNTFNNTMLGYAAVGSSGAMDLMTPNAPWARWHLVHEATGTLPDDMFRPWMRNGVMGTGHSDLFYMGHKYAMIGGTGAEENEKSNMVA
jgi:hypothetical protein